MLKPGDDLWPGEALKEAPTLRFDELYSEAYLYKAAVRMYTKPLFSWRKALATSVDRRTLYDFARDGTRNIDRIHRRLETHRFHFRPGLALYRTFNGRTRVLYVYPWEERLVDCLIYRMVAGSLESWFSPSSYAYRVNGYGVDRAQSRIAQRMADADAGLFVMKRDISDFFGSIDHEALREQLLKLMPANDYLHTLLIERLCFPYVEGGQIHTARRGVPFGTPVACVFANIALTEMDRSMDRVPGLHYFRYGDDVLAFSRSREAWEQARTLFDEQLSRLRLESKASHEMDFAFSTSSDPRPAPEQRDRFRHLGLEFRADGSVGLSRDKSRKIRNRFRFAFRRKGRAFARLKDPGKRARLAIRVARDVLEQGIRNVAIIDYYLRHVTDESQLRLLDRWLAEEVLSIAFDNGHKKGSFRRLSFRRLRAMGLPSLVHRRRLILHGHVESPFFRFTQSRMIRGYGEGAARPASLTIQGLSSVPGSSSH